MIITPIYLEDYGFHLEAAAVEIQEISSRKDTSFEDKNDPIMPFKDGYVTINVWANEQAYLNGMKPIYKFQKPVILDYQAKSTFHQNVLNQFVLNQQ